MPFGSDGKGGAPQAQRPARLLLAAIVAIARAAGFRMLVMSRIRDAAIRLGAGQKERLKYPEKSLPDNNS